MAIAKKTGQFSFCLLSNLTLDMLGIRSSHSSFNQ